MSKKFIERGDWVHQSVVTLPPEYVVVSRTTSDVIMGTTGAPDDTLQKVIVSVSPTVADLVISDNGVTHLTIPIGTPVGAEYDVGYMCITAWTVDLHATGAGTLICVGRFS